MSGLSTSLFLVAALLVASLLLALVLAVQLHAQRARCRIADEQKAARESELENVLGQLQVARERSSISENRFRILFDLAPVGIAVSELRSGRFLHANDAFVEPTGFSRAEVQQFDFPVLFPKALPEQELLNVCDDKGRFGPVESVCALRNGETLPVLIAGIVVRDEQGLPVVWSIVQDISARKIAEARAAEAAMRDKLTGLANRDRFNDQLDAAMRRVRKGKQERLCVLFLDFDRFKIVNDTLGHDAGDDLLKQIADRLRKTLRSSDEHEGSGNLIARFGGDEFVILINDLRSTADAEMIANRLLNALAPAYRVKGQEITSTASIGIVTTDNAAESTQEMVRNADVAMYEAKRSGRGCAVLFNEAMHTRLARQLEIESGLRKALGTSELWLAYQPVVDLQTGSMVYAEALARWTHPVLGEVSPAEFIVVAEERGLIAELGDWVLEESCRQLRAWIDTAPDRVPERISVNISRQQLTQGDVLVDRVLEVLSVYNLPASSLQLEITENEVMYDTETVYRMIERLQKQGVRVAMDDFGTGSSSLACLRQFQFDSVKIDRSFLADLGGSPETLAVLHATVNLIENLGMESVAEGVETATQAGLLQSLGCRFAQGYLYSKPVPAETLIYGDPGESGQSVLAAG